MVEDGAFGHEIDYSSIFLNSEGHPNCITGSRATAILLNGHILLFGGASLVDSLLSTGLPSLVFDFLYICIGL